MVDAAQATDGATPEAATTTADDAAAGAELGDRGKEVIRKERAAAKAAEDRASAAEKERDALLAEKRQREAAEAEVKDEQAAARGEFEKLAAKRTAERDEARADAARLSATLDQYKTAMEHGLAEAFAALPEELRKLWKGPEEDILGRFRFVHDPDLAVLARQLEQRAAAIRGNGHDPRSSIGGARSSDEAARNAQAAMYRNL